MKKIIITFLVVGVVTLTGCTANNTNPNQSNTVSSQINVNLKQEETPKSYVEIAKFSGKGGKNTDSFMLEGGRIKLNAKTWGGTKNIGTSSYFYLKPKDDSLLLGNSINIQADGDEEVEDYTIIRNLLRGDYYITANSGVSWEVTIFEDKGKIILE